MYRIGIVHARMDKEDIDSVMTDFYEGNIDILLATTIIENGIDVRNANLLLVENADRFGLAQLYQIKGRVGRGDRMAFAYLMIKQNKEITEDAKKRLKAIQDFTELGSGYKIAQRDLLIRGAGDILGPEQAGFVDSVGIDMYIRLLNETIAEKKGEKVAQNNIKSLNTIDGYIPKNFAKNDDKYKGKQLISYSTPYNTYFYRQNHTLYLLIHSQQRENIILPITISAQKLLRFLIPQPPTPHTRYCDCARYASLIGCHPFQRGEGISQLLRLEPSDRVLLTGCGASPMGFRVLYAGMLQEANIAKLIHTSIDLHSHI